ncbi:MAG: isoprenylcysteine carboxylmethyltransferase family protein [Clostridia bacterium]|nr:isoprenylcysteine carboxylmethyltransferase family protein [Clostridia bacterium]
MSNTLSISYRIGSVLVLAAFYAFYLGKSFSQKKHGIKTNQMAKGKEKGRTYYIELLLGVATTVIIPVQIASIVCGYSLMGMHAKLTGLCLGFIGVVFFAVSSITMKNSWRAGIPQEDKTEFVTDGIYKWSRNPAFLGFDMMYLGILIMYLNPVLAFFTVWAMLMLHLQILEEEKFLAKRFGTDYENYRKHVFRYLGRK